MFIHSISFKILEISEGVDDVGGLVMPLVYSLGIIWILVYFCVWRGVQWTGKVTEPSVFTCTFIGYNATLWMSNVELIFCNAQIPIRPHIRPPHPSPISVPTSVPSSVPSHPSHIRPHIRPHIRLHISLHAFPGGLLYIYVPLRCPHHLAGARSHSRWSS